MTKAILVCWHKYTPYGDCFYEPMLDFFLTQMKKFEDEYDMIYLIDSTWNIDPKKIKGMKAKIVKVNPSLRYYDAYKEVLPQVKEDLVLLLDNDMVVYKPHKIRGAFAHLEFSSEHPDVVSILASIGEYKTDKLNGRNKFCPSWFATRKDLLMKYLDIDWGSNMPHSETFGKLTEAMLNDGIKVYEWEEDYSKLEIDSKVFWQDSSSDTKSKDLGYYHIQAGSTASYILSCKQYYPVQYQEYIIKQPKIEYLRQFMWLDYMCQTTNNEEILQAILSFLKDVEVSKNSWERYRKNFINYHGLEVI